MSSLDFHFVRFIGRLIASDAAFANRIQRVGYLKLARLEGFGTRFKVQDYANRDTGELLK
jgi:hypothetical protein